MNQSGFYIYFLNYIIYFFGIQKLSTKHSNKIIKKNNQIKQKYKQKDIQQRLLEVELQEQMMDKELWLNLLSPFVLQWILLEIFMLEIIVQSE